MGTEGTAGGLNGRRQALGLVPVVVAVLTLCGVGGLLTALGPAAARPQAQVGRLAAEPSPPAAAAPPVSTASAPPPATAVPKRPIAIPADFYAHEAIVRIGTIEVPKLGVSAPMYDGVTLWNIDLGPSHWPGTAFPGQPGNAVIAGHRVTHSHPFLHIDQLVPGDQVLFNAFGWRSVYVVTGHDVVDPTDMAIANPTANATATLYSCHPLHSAKYRYVVHLVLRSGPTLSAS
jgi:sortase A